MCDLFPSSPSVTCIAVQAEIAEESEAALLEAARRQGTITHHATARNTNAAEDDLANAAAVLAHVPVERYLEQQLEALEARMDELAANNFAGYHYEFSNITIGDGAVMCVSMWGDGRADSPRRHSLEPSNRGKNRYRCAVRCCRSCRQPQQQHPGVRPLARAHHAITGWLRCLIARMVTRGAAHGLLRLHECQLH